MNNDIKGQEAMAAIEQWLDEPVIHWRLLLRPMCWLFGHGYVWAIVTNVLTVRRCPWCTHKEIAWFWSALGIK